MPQSQSLLSMRNILLLDAATCTVMGALLALASGPVGEITRIPPALLFHAGLSLFPIAAFMAIVATRRVVPPEGAWLVIVGNILWVVASVALPAAGWIAPNPIGYGFLAAQAVAVAVLAKLEHGALRTTAMQPQAG